MTYCPFVNDECREDCALSFEYETGDSVCLMALGFWQISRMADENKEEEKKISLEDKNLYSTSIDELGLSTRTKNALKKRGKIETIGQLTMATAIQILDIYEMGAKGLDEIEKALSEYGLQLRDSWRGKHGRN